MTTSTRTPLSTAPLAALDVGSRLGRLQARLADAEVDALLVTKLANVRYLTGFTGSAALLLVTRDAARFVTDGRYTQRAHEELDAAGATAEIEIGLTGVAQRELLVAAVPSGARLGLEEHSVTWAQQIDYAAAFAGVDIVPAGELVETLRRVKDAGEIDRIRRACAIADDAFQSLLAMLGERPTEMAFALALEFAMRERGASGNSFDPIVASGPNGSKPHHVPSNRVIERNELIVCDFGCIVEGYCSDRTRCAPSLRGRARESGRRTRCGRGRRRVLGGRPGVARRHRRGGLGRRVLALDGARRRVGDPRGTEGRFHRR
jgi:Xaa-Pro aminopeptidase